MQITDMLGQYNRNIANGVEIAGGTQGIRQVASSLSEMSVGNVFEGSVSHMENGVVTLGLPDGKSIQAKLDSGVSVKMGESMFFQVKSNNGAQIAIRPFSGSFGSNPTLLNALEAANLPVNGKTITMVNTMMEQSMSIDRQSLMSMARLIMGNDGMDVNSIVQMVKLGIPVTQEMIAQFENYKSDQYAILNQLESVMGLLPEELAGGNVSQEEMLALNREMMKVFLGEGELSSAIQTDGEVLEQPKEAQALQFDALGKPERAVLKTATDGGEGILQTRAEDALLSEEILKGAKDAPEKVQDGFPKEALEGDQRTTLKSLLSGSELQQMARHLAEIPEFAKNPALFQEGAFRGEVEAKEFLQLLAKAFASEDPFVKKAMGELTSSKEYRALVRNVMEQQWLIRPEELKTENKVKELYERLDRQLGQMEKVLKSFGQSAPQLSDTAANVRSNIQFMNQLNQIYAYMQIPLKLAGQNAHSDLYVYSDKRKKREKDGELTAFLHLDLDHLGSTDVSVKLRDKQVATDFYLADDASYQLILDNMEILQKRLEARGFQVKVQVAHQKKEADFLGSLLNQGTASLGGMVHRYSFDVRA